MKFTKWEGLGNDFVVCEGDPPANAPELARAVCDRHFGVGADGLVYLIDGPGMVIFNSDGSQAEICGNALRCLAALAVSRGGSESTQFQTGAGPRAVRVLRLQPWWVEVDMGVPERLKPHEGPGSGSWQTWWVNVGNPHKVILLPQGETLPKDWQAIGARFERISPGGINVEFVEVLAQDRLRVHVWERGAGATLACGTGACAAVAAAQWAGLCASHAQVELPGGTLEVALELGRLWMRGPARQLFEGTWRPDPR
jgi:diaminopimelate epimerase